MTQRDGLEPVAAHGKAADKGGSVKSLDADFLHTAFKGQQDAVDLVMALVRVSQCWDDLVDRDKPVGAGAINAAFYDALVGIPSNPFYRKHMDIFLPVKATACMNYAIANSFERAGSLRAPNLHDQKALGGLKPVPFL